jgi:hypothetical protein
MFNFNYVKREGISVCQRDLRYHGEESPTVEPEEGFFRGGQAVDYLRGPSPIIGTGLISSISGLCVVQESDCAGAVDPAPESVPPSASGKGLTAAME